MAKSPNWTNEELKLLREVYPKLGKSQELKDLFPLRPLEGICLKANRIGLRSEKANVRRTNEKYTKLLESTNFISLEEYNGSTCPILHRCKVCGHEWKTRPQHALREGANCPLCNVSSMQNTLSYVDSILDSAKMLRHSEYLGSLKPLVLEHLDCGFIWETKFSHIQQGSGCPICNKGYGNIYSAINMPKEAYLYVLEITLQECTVLKVGVTCRKPLNRFREIRYELLKIHSTSRPLAYYTSSGEHILLLEKEILNKFPRFTSTIHFAGHTELLQLSCLEELTKFLEGTECQKTSLV
jgi:rubrerythrin